MRGYHRCGAAISTAASKADDAPAQSPRTGLDSQLLSSVGLAKEGLDRCLRLFFLPTQVFSLRRLRTVQRHVVRLADPEPMEQHRQLASHCDHGSLLTVLAAALRELEPEPLQIAILAMTPQDVVAGLHQQPAQ